jgi:hypothetical protein
MSMEISIVFDTAFKGSAAGAVWIVESVNNRQWFERQSVLDEGSAVFMPANGEIGLAAIRRAIWNVQEHYPEWSLITVSGVSLTADLARGFREEGHLAQIDQGFTLTKL